MTAAQWVDGDTTAIFYLVLGILILGMFVALLVLSLRERRRRNDHESR